MLASGVGVPVLTWRGVKRIIYDREVAMLDTTTLIENENTS